MLSEGITSGKPVYALYPDDHPSDAGSLKATFVKRHVEARHIRRVHVSQLGSVDFEADRADYFKLITGDATKETVEHMLAIINRSQDESVSSSSHP